MDGEVVVWSGKHVFQDETEVLEGRAVGGVGRPAYHDCQEGSMGIQSMIMR